MTSQSRLFSRSRRRSGRASRASPGRRRCLRSVVPVAHGAHARSRSARRRRSSRSSRPGYRRSSREMPEESREARPTISFALLEPDRAARRNRGGQPLRRSPDVGELDGVEAALGVETVALKAEASRRSGDQISPPSKRVGDRDAPCMRSWMPSKSMRTSSSSSVSSSSLFALADLRPEALREVAGGGLRIALAFILPLVRIARASFTLLGLRRLRVLLALLAHRLEGLLELACRGSVCSASSSRVSTT